MPQNYELATLASYAANLDVRNTRPKYYSSIETILSTGSSGLSTPESREVDEWAQTPEAQTAILGRVTLLDAFEPFADFTRHIVRLTQEEEENPVNHSSFLGSGGISSVFLYPYNGATYTVRTPYDVSKDWFLWARHDALESYVDGLLLGKDMPYMEQIVALSYKHGATVSELCPGVNLPASQDFDSASAAHVYQFVDTVDTAIKKGICVDEYANNFLYDQQSGFYCIDYSSHRHTLSSQETSTALQRLTFTSYGQDIDERIARFTTRALNAYNALEAGGARDGMI